MAEYYPLLAKAVAGLPNSTPETRRAVYDRARGALLGQLRNLQPPVSAADLARETEALDAAVARLEAEFDGRPAAAAMPPKPAPPAWRPAPRPAAPQPPRAPVAPGMTPPRATPGAPASDMPERAGPESEAAPPADAFAPPPREPKPARPRPAEAVRPVPPQPDLGDAPMGRRLWIVVGVVVVLIASVAVAAWKLRDRADRLTAFNAFNKSTVHTAANKSSAKNTLRVGGAATPAAPASSAAAPAKTAAQAAAPAPAQSASSAAPAPATAGKTANAASAVPVAYRAALLVEAPGTPSKVKTYVGTVIWKLENVSNGPGQPLATAVHADIDVPDDKLKATVDIQKNSDPSLSASHTITIVFSLKPDSPTGGIKEISLPQLRNEAQPSGEPLRGIVVPIMNNSFLVGLSRGDAEAGNIQLLKSLAWIDIPIMLDNGRIAKLTFEKNISGSRAINDALASWQGN